MGLPDKLLGRNEEIVRHMHEHIKALFLNFIGLVLVVIVVALALTFVPDSWPSWSRWAIVVTAVIAAFIVFVHPWLKWATTTYTITNRRIITRTGIFSKTGHDIPLSRISNVSYRRDLVDRIFGSGTLILETSADNPLELHDVPKIEEVHVQLTEILFADSQTRDDSGEDL